jgi:hypothetical protein
MKTMATIDEVIRKHESSLFAIQGVTGVGRGVVEGKDCILVMLIQKLPGVEAEIPETIEGYPVAVEVSGVIQALQRPGK